MAFYIKDKNENYRQSTGAWGVKGDAEAFYDQILVNRALNQFSRMSLAATGATVVEE